MTKIYSSLEEMKDALYDKHLCLYSGIGSDDNRIGSYKAEPVEWYGWYKENQKDFPLNDVQYIGPNEHVTLCGSEGGNCWGGRARPFETGYTLDIDDFMEKLVEIEFLQPDNNLSWYDFLKFKKEILKIKIWTIKEYYGNWYSKTNVFCPIKFHSLDGQFYLTNR